MSADSLAVAGERSQARPRRGRNIFIVANNFEELGGVQRVAHTLATHFTARGNRVVVVGINHADEPHDYGSRDYDTVVLSEDREPKRGVDSFWASVPTTAQWFRRRRKDRMRQDAVARLSRLFREVDDGIV